MKTVTCEYIAKFNSKKPDINVLEEKTHQSDFIRFLQQKFLITYRRNWGSNSNSFRLYSSPLNSLLYIEKLTCTVHIKSYFKKMYEKRNWKLKKSKSANLNRKLKSVYILKIPQNKNPFCWTKIAHSLLKIKWSCSCRNFIAETKPINKKINLALKNKIPQNTKKPADMEQIVSKGHHEAEQRRTYDMITWKIVALQIRMHSRMWKRIADEKKFWHFS